MFKGYNLTISSNDFVEKWYPIGLKHFQSHQKQIEEVIANFSTKDGALDGTKLQANWFPQVNSTIFISHAHKNEKKAIALAGILKENLNIDTFVDSCIWGYAGTLQRLVDDEYCLNDSKKTYDYKKRNRSTSHVHMMLSIALFSMIDKSECLFFLNTPDSIVPSSVINGKDGSTLSPWIYSEIACTSLIHKKSLDEHRSIRKTAKSLAEDRQLSIKYDVDLSHLTPLSEDLFDKWLDLSRRNSINPMDILYKLV